MKRDPVTIIVCVAIAAAGVFWKRSSAQQAREAENRTRELQHQQAAALNAALDAERKRLQEEERLAVEAADPQRAHEIKQRRDALEHRATDIAIKQRNAP